jgi:hypothetical protein
MAAAAPTPVAEPVIMAALRSLSAIILFLVADPRRVVIRS